MDGYRDRYIYNLGNIQSFCKSQPNECPLVMHKNYTIDTSIFLSEDDEQSHSYGFGSRNVLKTSYLIKIFEKKIQKNLI